jgi:hypothetical protein
LRLIIRVLRNALAGVARQHDAVLPHHGVVAAVQLCEALAASLATISVAESGRWAKPSARSASSKAVVNTLIVRTEGLIFQEAVDRHDQLLQFFPSSSRHMDGHDRDLVALVIDHANDVAGIVARKLAARCRRSREISETTLRYP